MCDNAENIIIFLYTKGSLLFPIPGIWAGQTACDYLTHFSTKKSAHERIT